MSSLGLALPVLLAQQAVLRNASPQFKVSARGYLQYLLTQNRPRVLEGYIDDGTGYIKSVNIRYKKRLGLGHSRTTKDCNKVETSPYFTATLPSTNYREYAMGFEWSVIDKFTEDALAQRKLPGSTPPTEVMQEVLDSFQVALNGLLGDIDNDLLTTQAISFGKNIASGAATPRTLNFPLVTGQNNLSEGWTMLLADAMKNEIAPNLGSMSIVGDGLINNFFLKQGFDGTAAPTLPKFFFDPLSQARWGANQFGLFDKDAVQFINICRNRGAAKSGRFGISKFGTLKWPITDFLGNSLGDLEFDFQVRELDCPTVIEVNGANQTFGPGLVVILSCSYQQFNVPSDSYAADDPLYLSNGTLRYVATNIDSTAAVTP